jgi:hypothetical protein
LADIAKVASDAICCHDLTVLKTIQCLTQA